MSNVKLSYLYRDGANYKNHRFLIFTNPTNIALANIKALLYEKLIDGTWFYTDEWNLPDLHCCVWDSEVDHTWHEIDSIESTDEVGNATIENFIGAIRHL
jgi:hypothetical protein